MAKNRLSSGFLWPIMMVGPITVSSQTATRERSSCYSYPHHIRFSLLVPNNLRPFRYQQKQNICPTWYWQLQRRGSLHKGQASLPSSVVLLKTDCKASHTGLDQKRWRRCIFGEKKELAIIGRTYSIQLIQKSSRKSLSILKYFIKRDE